MCSLLQNNATHINKENQSDNKQGKVQVMRNFYLSEFEEWPLHVAKIGDDLNPFHDDKVELYAVVGYHMPYETLKFLAVKGILEDALSRGMLENTKTLIEATSGAYGLVLAGLAKSFGIKNVILVMKNDVPLGKKYPPYLAGARIIPPEEGLSPIGTARKLGGGGWKKSGWERGTNGWLNLDQYANPANTKLYEDWLTPKIIKNIPNLSLIAAPVGTGGTIIGLSKAMRGTVKNTTILGVMCSPGNEIPGARDLNAMKEISLPWREAIDEKVEVETKISYLSSLQILWKTGLTPGASGGMAYAGVIKFLKEEKRQNRSLDRLRNSEGKIVAAIIFHDSFRPYVADRFTVFLPEEWQKPSTAPLPWEII